MCPEYWEVLTLVDVGYQPIARPYISREDERIFSFIVLSSVASITSAYKVVLAQLRLSKGIRVTLTVT